MEIVVARGPLPQGPGDLSPQGQETTTQSVVETPEMVCMKLLLNNYYKNLNCEQKLVQGD